MVDEMRQGLKVLVLYICGMASNGMVSKDPLHGKTLEMILNELVEHFGWEDLGSIIDIRCFRFDPSIKSSLAFLRKTPWARKKVEDLYVSIHRPDGSGEK
jgi:uncharacterized protein (DUF2132 family)